jgi:hypothetical protein
MKKKKLTLNKVKKLLKKYTLSGGVSGGGDDGAYHVDFQEQIEEKDKEDIETFISILQEHMCYNLDINFDGNVSVSGDLRFDNDDINDLGIRLDYTETSSENSIFIKTALIPINIIPIQCKFNSIQFNKYAYEDGFDININCFNSNDDDCDKFCRDLEEYLNDTLDLKEGQYVYEFFTSADMVNKKYLELSVNEESEECYSHFMRLKEIFK